MSILHGIDIESSQFPKERPSNLSFSVCSVLALPKGWERTFDFVHQRLLGSALKSAEWSVALSQLFHVLKPRGWVQLGDFGEWSKGAGPESACTKLKRLHKAFYESRGFSSEISLILPRLLREAGFVSVFVEVLSISLGKSAGEKGSDGARNSMAFFRAVKEPILRDGGYEMVGSGDEYDGLIDNVEKEWKETEGHDVEFHIICAQRPPTCII